MNRICLEVNGYGPIDYANIELNKINVIGGVNSSGKSTVSQLLYCFLKANILNKDNFLYSNFVDKVNELINDVDSSKSSKFNYQDDFSKVAEEYDIYKRKYEKIHQKSYRIDVIDELLDALHNDEDYRLSYITRSLIDDEHLSYFNGSSRLFTESFESLITNVDIDAEFDDAGFIQKVNEDYDVLSDLYMYKTKGNMESFSDVFYISPFSLLDIFNYVLLEKRRASYEPEELLKEMHNSPESEEFLNHNDHIAQLINILAESEIPNLEEIDIDILDVVNEIQEIINGYITRHPISIDFGFLNNSYMYGMGNTSSGIKQIGIIQLLLMKEKLKPNSMLIIDEPEVNLHPEWQFKFAEILVLIAQELDIHLYLNSHSPMFIESIDAFCEYYDMEDDVSFYLTEESLKEGKYNFTKINSNELFKLYNNLGNPYHLIDQLRLRKKLGE